MSISARIRSSYKVGRIISMTRNSGLWVLATMKRVILRSEIRKRRELHIHFGCGNINDARFLNIDARPFYHVDFVTRSPMLRPFGNGSADSIYACHVFEHFPVSQQAAVVKRWFEILKPGGKLRLSVPDFDKLIAKYIEGNRNIRDIEFMLMGGQDYRGNFHHAIFNRDHLTCVLESAGFVNILNWHPKDEKNWPRDHSWNVDISLNLVGEKPIQ